MGMYTEIFVNVDLLPDTPGSVIETLLAMCAGQPDSPFLEDKPDDWGQLFRNASVYVAATETARMVWQDCEHHWSLLGKGDIKNGEKPVKEFFEWLAPYVDRRNTDFIGYFRHEKDSRPTPVFAPDGRPGPDFADALRELVNVAGSYVSYFRDSDPLGGDLSEAVFQAEMLLTCFDRLSRRTHQQLSERANAINSTEQ